MTVQRESLVNKVRALLAKTMESGCTEGEALAAIEKANAMIAAHEIAAGGKGTPSIGTLKWRFPRVVELKYPDIIKSTEDWDNWVKGVNLDRRISDRTRRVLTMLALFYNLRTGQCNPAMHHLAMMAGLGEDEAAEVMARTAIASGERVGWVKRVYRRGGHRHNQSNEYRLLTPEAVQPRPNILEQNKGADRTNLGGRP